LIARAVLPAASVPKEEEEEEEEETETVPAMAA
jgi:hypothetical protein